MRRKYVLILAVLAVAVALLVMPSAVSERMAIAVRDLFSPVQGVFASAGGVMRGAVDGLRGREAAGDRVERLLAENELLRMQVHQLRAAEQELPQVARLRAAAANQDLVFCEVTARADVTGWWRSLTLDKGADSGIRIGMAVTASGGLIGKVVSVARQSSDVLLITDPSCRIPCRTVGAGAYGILGGGGTDAGRGGAANAGIEMLAAVNPCRLEYVALESPLRAGDTVETSGLGGTFPSGIAVGRVSAVEMDISGLYQRCSVVPFTDLSALRYVFVVRTRAGGVPGSSR
ncbi:MAG: rod shape-determining protein MreC [Lentisphaerae bacterium]|nr:rod shape-determining protein MreC [Lentisphaerota bacterium]